MYLDIFWRKNSYAYSNDKGGNAFLNSCRIVVDFCVHKCYYLCVPKREVRNMSPRTGRPTENPKSEIIKIRATKEDREKLLYCCEKTGMTQYEVVMNGLEKVYSEIIGDK